MGLSALVVKGIPAISRASNEVRTMHSFHVVEAVPIAADWVAVEVNDVVLGFEAMTPRTPVVAVVFRLGGHSLSALNGESCMAHELEQKWSLPTSISITMKRVMMASAK